MILKTTLKREGENILKLIVMCFVIVTFKEFEILQPSETIGLFILIKLWDLEEKIGGEN